MPLLFFWGGKRVIFSRSAFSWKSGGPLQQNIQKPSQDLIIISIVKKNYISSAVSDILQSTDRQTHTPRHPSTFIDGLLSNNLSIDPFSSSNPLPSHPAFHLPHVDRLTSSSGYTTPNDRLTSVSGYTPPNDRLTASGYTSHLPSNLGGQLDGQQRNTNHNVIFIVVRGKFRFQMKLSSTEK